MSDHELSKIIDIFINNLPEQFKNTEKPMVIDLVLDGGVFNGSYLIGALFLLKEMEKRNYIKVERISGCSIGSLLGFLYFIDQLEIVNTLYEMFANHFKETQHLEKYMQLKEHLKNKIPADVCTIINKKLYIKYNNIEKGVSKVKRTYQNEDDLINTIIRSSFFPYLIDGTFAYQNKYIDGLNPYIFKKHSRKKIVFLDLCGLDKLSYIINIKNETSNFHRVLFGLVDMYTFLIKQSESSMCSCVNEWNFVNSTRFHIRLFIEKIICKFFYILHFLKKYIPNSYNDHIVYKITSKVCHDIFIILLTKYCL
jgi:hypothetical protein